MLQMAKRGGQIQRIEISEEERAQLESMIRSRSLPHGLVRRARIILMSAEGIHTAEIARACGTSRPAVSRWRTRYRQLGLAGLYDEMRIGRPRSIDDERVAELINIVLDQKPANAPH